MEIIYWKHWVNVQYKDSQKVTQIIEEYWLYPFNQKQSNNQSYKKKENVFVTFCPYNKIATKNRKKENRKLPPMWKN